MTQKNKINAKGVEISVLGKASDENAFISLTDIAKFKNAEDPRIVITNWMSTYATIDFLAVWEELHNPDFNRMEFQSVRSEPGRLIMTPKKWIELTGSIGIESKRCENIRDYASAEELVVLINLESLNSELIKEGLDHEVRYHRLREAAKQQMDVLIRNHTKKALQKVNPNLLKGGDTNVD